MTTTEESTSYKCADPPPQIVTYTNSITNETLTESIPAKINSMQVVFDYSIFHTDDTSFGAKKSQEESKGMLGSLSDTISTITDTVNNLFGDDEDEEGKENLIALEKCMVDNVWKGMLADEKMTWVEEDESQCAGFMIDEVSRRLQEDDNNTLIEIEQDEPIVSDDNTGVDQSQPLVIDDAAMDQTQPAADDISDTEEVDAAATTFSGTKLIGMDSLPLDMINTAGCASGTSSCTFVRGVISVSYIGTNENAVSDSIARMVQDGMKSGSLLCAESPATKLEFDSFVGNGKGGHGALILDTNRGMAPPEESNDLTSYGIMFVLFVALLSVGVIFGVLYKRKKKQKAARGSSAVADFEANLELEEGVSRSQTRDISVSSDERMTRMVEMSANDDFGTSGVELSLSPSKSVT